MAVPPRQKARYCLIRTLVQFVAPAAVQDDGALFHHVTAVRQLQGELEVLLDQQHRDVALVLQPLQHAADERDDRRLDAPVGSSRIEGRCRRRSGRWLAAAAGRRSGRRPCGEHLLEHREAFEDALGTGSAPFGLASRPTCRFSSTVSCGKISRPCGT